MLHSIIFWSKVKEKKMNSKIILGVFFANAVDLFYLEMLAPLPTFALQDPRSRDIQPMTMVRKESPCIERGFFFSPTK
jgi:hypothetical protein